MINIVLIVVAATIFLYHYNLFALLLTVSPFLLKKYKLNSKVISTIILISMFSYIYISFFYYKLNDNSSMIFENQLQVIVHDKLDYGNEYNISFIGKIQSRKYLVSVPKKIISDDLKYGDMIEIDSYTISPIKNTYKNPSSFDYERYMRQKLVVNKMKVNKLSSVVTSKKKYFIKNFRYRMIKKLHDEKPEVSAYINALVFGENDIDTDTKQIFSSVGISHALTISGTHVIILIGIYKRIMRRLNVYEGKIERSLFFLLPLYGTMTGGQIPVLRAIIVELASIQFKEKIDKITILKVLCLGNLILNPGILFNTSFVLSYSICFFIYYIDHFNVESKILEYAKPSLLIMLFIFPIIVSFNYQYNIFSFICSIILTPVITSILLPMAFANLFFQEATLINYIFEFVIKLIENIARLFDFFTLTTGHLNSLCVIIYYLTYLLYYVKNQILYLWLLLLFIFASFFNINIVGSVNIIDVGQGDAILIVFPFNRGNILIDSGPESSRHELVKFLRYKGINKIDHLFITHWHNDHYGGNELLLSEFGVDKIYTFESDSIPSQYKNLTFIRAGDNLTINNSLIQILSPFHKDSDNLNNESLTILMELGGKKWLFTGDIEKDVEGEIIKSYKNLIDIDYLKVPHHGSKTSSSIDFINATTPKFALVSVGENNRFKHPSTEIIERYENLNIKVLQTKDVGIIRYNFIFSWIWYNS